MIGAICGDTIGSPFEYLHFKSKQFGLFNPFSGLPRTDFTDDSVASIAVADSFMNNKDIHTTLQDYCNKYPDVGWGNNFFTWAYNRLPEQMESWGNGAAMRASPCAYLSDDLEVVLDYARRSAAPSHCHADGLAGAQATAGAVFTALHTKSKDAVKAFVEKFYPLDFNYENLVETYSYHYECKHTVPQAVYCFLISDSWEDCLRTTVSIDGDTDTLCAISCAIAEAYYGGVPEKIWKQVLTYFYNAPDLLQVIIDFNKKYLPYGYDISFTDEEFAQMLQRKTVTEAEKDNIYNKILSNMQRNRGKNTNQSDDILKKHLGM
jgi:ADP-ribosylglycohydrolase